MPEKIKDVNPPRGLARLVYRLPIWLYRVGLGGLLGDRFLLLEHTGRKSGLTRRTVLEVVRHDREAQVYYVASGWGEKSDWFKNVTAHPQVTVQAGRRRMQAVAQRLPVGQAGDELVNYTRRHPTAMKELARIMGYRLDGSEADVRLLAQEIPLLAFRPREE